VQGIRLALVRKRRRGFTPTSVKHCNRGPVIVRLRTALGQIATSSGAKHRIAFCGMAAGVASGVCPAAVHEGPASSDDPEEAGPLDDHDAYALGGMLIGGAHVQPVFGLDQIAGSAAPGA